jgi:hypothetical protein
MVPDASGASKIGPDVPKMADITVDGESAELMQRLKQSPNVPGVDGLGELREEIARATRHQCDEDAAAADAIRIATGNAIRIATGNAIRMNRRRRAVGLAALWIAASAVLGIVRLVWL